MLRNSGLLGSNGDSGRSCGVTRDKGLKPKELRGKCRFSCPILFAFVHA